MNNDINKQVYTARRRILIGGFFCITVVLTWRAVDLHIINNEFLRDHGDIRSLRVVDINAHRGMIVDRNDEPLAISTPVATVGAYPRKLLAEPEGVAALASLLEMETEDLVTVLRDRIGRDFIYLKRHVSPDLSADIESLGLPGVHLQREFKRYYPAGEVTSHLIGFTNVDDEGQEGLELAYDDWLRGIPGSKRVLKDSLGRTIQDVENIKSSVPGKKLVLSIDRRVQYLAYRELVAAVTRHQARGGSLVILDIRTGEVIALVGQPSYNPNNRAGLTGEQYRNRAVTDVFEPGSTVKPFTIAAALMSGLYTPDTLIDTAPGFMKLNNYTIRENNNYNFKTIDLAHVIVKSSNVGASKIALSLGPERIWEMYSSFGMGRISGSGYPGESPGLFHHYRSWSEVELATIAYGYGVAVTTLQLAQAYSIIASGGVLKPVSFTRVDTPVNGVRVIPEQITKQITDMLEAVTKEDGTGQRAAIEGYNVAGKTGTAHKTHEGGYAQDRYRSLFAGFAPATDPVLALVVMVDEPEGLQHYGGQVAAPVFANVMKGALRLMNIPPDAMNTMGGEFMALNNKQTGHLSPQ